MSIKHNVIKKMLEDNILKEYDTINLDNINFYVKYGTNIIKHEEVPTLTTKCNVAVVVNESVNG